MPNLTVECPNCGSRDCNEYRQDSFVCRHCDSTFRWTNPNTKIVIHNRTTCHCGKKPVGVCTACQAPMCRDHKTGLNDLLNNWFAIKQMFIADAPKWTEFALRQGGLATCTLKRQVGWLQGDQGINSLVNHSKRYSGGLDHPFFISSSGSSGEAIKRIFGLTQSDETSNLMCSACLESTFVRVFLPLEAHILELWDAGKICRPCATEWESECRSTTSGFFPFKLAPYARQLCPTCSIPVCHSHKKECVDCKQHFDGWDGKERCNACWKKFKERQNSWLGWLFQ